MKELQKSVGLTRSYCKFPKLCLFKSNVGVTWAFIPPKGCPKVGHLYKKLENMPALKAHCATIQYPPDTQSELTDTQSSIAICRHF